MVQVIDYAMRQSEDGKDFFKILFCNFNLFFAILKYYPFSFWYH